MRLASFTSSGPLSELDHMINLWLEKNTISPESSKIIIKEHQIEDPKDIRIQRTVYIFYVPLYPVR